MISPVFSTSRLIPCLLTALLIPSLVADTGSDRYAAGDYLGSISWYQDMLNQTEGSDQAPILNNIGTGYMALGLQDIAFEYYLNAVSVDSGYDRGYLNLGVVQEKLENPDDALHSYGKVSGQDPALYAEALVKKGTLLSSLGRLDEALNAFHQAESGATGLVQVDLYTGIGAVYFMQNKTDEAEKNFLKAIHVDPSGAALALTNLGVLQIAQGRMSEAKKSFVTAIRNDPSGMTKAAAYLKRLTVMTGGAI
ncbi:tetratricopeptide repeat protein [Methanospirillum stamsii]|uniref:Uncharacterized protein n=1 Tax=Methanospirillum stamsii TaxID=1277351 RepID=A0A2V2N8B1_9EURY|nr:tetratricopeptide repeat protein [Methanospirillum stamsii]PWR74910.1 hypothetical protein DLD82_06690 [Methanospirillum stamsii]